MEGILFPHGVAQEHEGLKEYRARGGYEALAKAIRTPPEDVVKVVSDAGLRGRGGAGFPTGKKWQFTREAPGEPRYLILNGGEDEPGSKKDRVLLENLPHLVIEGTVLAAYAIGATKAYLYINANYAVAIKTITDALTEAKAAGYWGENILGSDFALDIEIVPAPHNYVAGEDTAALEVIEGRKAWPRQKPPFPVTIGLYGKPTSVNNVETLANVAPIVLQGADWYRKFGTAESTGTMIFSLDDDVNRPGVYELPFGTPLRYLIEECGGGMKGGKPIKAIMPAAPSSAYLPPEKIDTPLDHKSMRDAGSGLGCGVVRLVAEGTCIVEEVIKISEFFTAESCGQCPACRMETNTLTSLLKKVQAGQGGQPILEQFAKVLAFNKGKGFCNLIAMPGPPIESALKLFPGDFAAHLSTGKCPVN
ncbi:MAG TPA: NADH-ubiquinone oxidoreductase-F iron-sulfur binding region domain-containing protein [Candidatus Binatia bacterium]|jgi:NADH-quinone oxidoreductase subunit F|nr:NADH-ubiquinone oxidoreductase-F iron-sulfur binding region domain-containing protein [Candidatus Binatia bacterium]